jgi:hypothetical protein
MIFRTPLGSGPRAELTAFVLIDASTMSVLPLSLGIIITLLFQVVLSLRGLIFKMINLCNNRF